MKQSLKIQLMGGVLILILQEVLLSFTEIRASYHLLWSIPSVIILYFVATKLEKREG